MDEPTGQTFRAWLAQVMADRRVGIRQLEKYAGVSRSSLSAILRGETLPSMESVSKLAAYFSANAQRLMAMVYAEKYNAGVAELPGALTYQEVDLEDPSLSIQLWLDAHRELSPEELQAIKDLVRWQLERSRKRRAGGPDASTHP